MDSVDQMKFKSIMELLFFDNLALFYIIDNTPPQVLARILNIADGRLAASILGILEPQQRKVIHVLMGQEKDTDEEKNNGALKAMLQIATDLYARGLIYNSGKHYFGAQSEEKLVRPDR